MRLTSSVQAIAWLTLCLLSNESNVRSRVHAFVTPPACTQTRRGQGHCHLQRHGRQQQQRAASRNSNMVSTKTGTASGTTTSSAASGSGGAGGGVGSNSKSGNRFQTGSTAAASTSSSLYTTPEPLASDGDWCAYLDEESTGLIYYFNGKTGESRWEPPTRSFPVVTLTREKRAVAEQKRAEYIQAVEEQLEEEEKGVLQSLLEEVSEPQQPYSFQLQQQQLAETQKSEAAVDMKAKKEQPNWFGFLFEQPDTTTASSTTMTTGAATAPAKTEEKGVKTTLPKKKKEEKPLVEKKTKKQKASTTESTAAAAAVEPSPVKKQPSFFDRVFARTQQDTLPEPVMADPSSTTPKELIITPAPAPAAEPVVVAPAPIQIDMAAYVVPHPAKMFWGGEDAVMTAGRTFAIFDGVSGASKQDGLPLYSKTLAKELKRIIVQNNDEDKGFNAFEMTRKLSQAAEIADETGTGASTAIIASICQDGFLRALNLGDSACIIIRKGVVVARTKEISHYFDCPYQLSADSPDRPRDSTKLNVELMRGDMIVMASDGVFDNLSDEQIIEIVTSSSSPSSSPLKSSLSSLSSASSSSSNSRTRVSAIAKRLADQARKVSLNKKAATPYAKQAQKNGDPDYEDGVGGKLDDISCIVVRYE